MLIFVCVCVCFEKIPVPHLREFDGMHGYMIGDGIIQLLEEILYRLIGTCSLSDYFRVLYIYTCWVVQICYASAVCII